MTPVDACRETNRLCRLAPVIPVLVIDDIAIAVPLAEALISGGLPVLEVTLRSSVALEAIRQMTKVADATVGAGTLLNAKDVHDAKAAGAAFGVSPGATDGLLDSCEACDLPIIPGAVTSSEVMRLLHRGYSVQKFFPAGTTGGIAALAALASPFPQVRFCPTGGISAANAVEFLALPNTVCVGGSWVAPKVLVANRDWRAIEELAQQAAELGS